MTRTVVKSFTLAGAFASGAHYEVEDDEHGTSSSVTLFEVRGPTRYGRLSAPTLSALIDELRGILTALTS